MAKHDVLERAYEAIGRLRATGLEKLNVEKVADAAGLARSTFYLPDPDWQEIRQVIKGKPSTRVKLVEIEVATVTRSTRKIAELRERMDRVEAELESVRQTADTVYRKLIDQLQYYFALAAETPAKREKQTKLLKESGRANQEAKRLQAENANLREQLRLIPNTTPLVNKRYITLPNELNISDYYCTLLDQLAQNFPDEHAGQTIGAVFVMCGLPLAGKTQWTRDHKPLAPGVAVYIDGTSHKADIRKFITDRVRKLTAAPVSCVRVRTSKEVCIERSGRALRGANHIRTEQTIELISKEFEEVSLAEPFNAIILV